MWHSFGTLIKESASRVLQIVPDDIQVGVRPMRDHLGRIQGEVFIYDDVPGGAGYARLIEANLSEVVDEALQMGLNCDNPDCSDACYHCLLGYRNQRTHNLLSRGLGSALLEYLLLRKRPDNGGHDGRQWALNISEYGAGAWEIVEGTDAIPIVFETRRGNRIGIVPVHPLNAQPLRDNLAALKRATGVSARAYTTFDLERRPYWMADEMLRTFKGW